MSSPYNFYFAFIFLKARCLLSCIKTSLSSVSWSCRMACADPKNPDFLSHKRTSQRAVLTSIDGRSIPVYFRKHSNLFFPGRQYPLPLPPDPPMDGEKYRSPCMLKGLLFLLCRLILLRKSNNVVFAIKHRPIFSVILRPVQLKILVQRNWGKLRDISLWLQFLNLVLVCNMCYVWHYI